MKFSQRWLDLSFTPRFGAVTQARINSRKPFKRFSNFSQLTVTGLKPGVNEKADHAPKSRESIIHLSTSARTRLISAA
jgi:hypothetical protein